jgi:hypothetical protein
MPKYVLSIRFIKEYWWLYQVEGRRWGRVAEVTLAETHVDAFVVVGHVGTSFLKVVETFFLVPHADNFISFFLVTSGGVKLSGALVSGKLSFG